MPYVYLIPCGADTMRSPSLGDTSTTRSWDINDMAIPLPFNIIESRWPGCVACHESRRRERFRFAASATKAGDLILGRQAPFTLL